MAHFADTNVAARRVLPADPQHLLVTRAIDTLREQGEIVHITSQVLVEFHALATRPVAVNGLGMTSSQASVEARRLEAIFPLWRTLVDTYGVVGRQVFDARLVAVMQAHGVTHLLTLNPTHFRRFSGITVVEPKDDRNIPIPEKQS